MITSDFLYATPQAAATEVLDFLGVKGVVPEFKFKTNAPKNAACKKPMDEFIDQDELGQLREFYANKNTDLPALLGMEIGWIPSG